MDQGRHAGAHVGQAGGVGLPADRVPARPTDPSLRFDGEETPLATTARGGGGGQQLALERQGLVLIIARIDVP